MRHSTEQIDWGAWRAAMATLPPMARLVAYEMAGVMWARGRASRMSFSVADVMRATGLGEAEAVAAVRALCACNADVTLACNADVTQCNADVTPKEKDEKKGSEKKEEKECNQSSAPARTCVREYADESPRPDTGGGRVVVQPPTEPRQVMDAAAVQGIALSEAEALRFIDFYAARGWLDRYQRPFADWRRLIREHKHSMQRWESNANGNADQRDGGAGRRDNGGPSRCGDPRNTPADFDADWRRFHGAGAGAGVGAGMVRVGGA